MSKEMMTKGFFELPPVQLQPFTLAALSHHFIVRLKPYLPAQEVFFSKIPLLTPSTESLISEPSPGFPRPPPPKSKFQAKPAESKTEQSKSKPVVLPLLASALQSQPSHNSPEPSTTSQLT